MKMNTKKLVIIGLMLLAFLSMAVTAATAVPPLIPSSEQLIASMELNQSAGNMTGDDYLVACVFVYINDTLEDKFNPLYKNYGAILDEAGTKFPEYDFGRMRENINYILNYMMEQSADRECFDNGNRGSGCSLTFVQPLQGYIDFAIDRMFNRTCEGNRNCNYHLNINGHIDEAHAVSQLRLAEEARQKTLLLEREEQQKTAQQEKEAQQHALDAHYKNLSESYSINLTALLNQSKLDDALNRSNESIGNLVSPYSNIMMISKGDIYASMGMYEAAIESYKSAQTDFTYESFEKPDTNTT